MSYFENVINKSGKGFDSSKELVYLLDISLGGTMGTSSYATIGRDSEGEFYKPKIGNTGGIHRSVNPETGEFEVSDLNLTMANGDLEFSKHPWNDTILNKHADFRLGIKGGDTEYFADGWYKADGSVLASGIGSPLGFGLSGDISIGINYTLYKGIIKKEERGNKEFKLSIGDYTNKIFMDIPPRIVSVAEFPFIGTSVKVFGTKTDADTSLVGKRIPFIYGDFTDSPIIKPIFADINKKRYLIADHGIGTMLSVVSGGTRVYNFTHPNINGYVAGTHLTGTNIMSFIDFGTSQGTKNVYVSIKGRYDSYNNLIQNPALLLKDILLSNNICDLIIDDIGTASFDITQNWLNPYNYRYIMDGEIHKTSIDLIHSLNINSLSNFYFNRENKANFDTYRPAVSRVDIKKVSGNEILEDSFSITRNINDVYNKVIVNYKYDYIKKEYKDSFEVGGTAYIDKFDTVKTFTIDSPFIFNLTEAEFIGRKWLSRLQNGINRLQFSLPLFIMPLDICDRLQLSHEEFPSMTGGCTDRLINIIDFEFDTKNKQVNIQGIDEDEVSLNKKFFILGGVNNTLYPFADESQKQYGALCDSNGLFSNNQPGYILW